MSIQDEALNKVKPELEAIMAKLIADNIRHIEDFTKAQFVSAITQAIECGDFTRYIWLPDGEQQVIYTPFIRLLDLQAKHANMAKVLEALLKHYVTLVSSGDCGCWNPEVEQEVINAREALSRL